MGQLVEGSEARAVHGIHPPAVGHVVPARLLGTVLALLLALTFATVAITWVDLGGLNLWLALGIAVLKASLVALFFMHLRWDRPFNAIVFIASLALVMLFVGIALMDSRQYRPEMIPGYAPGIETRK